MTDDNNPRKPEIIREELRELELSTASSREWLREHPADKIVALLVEQDEIRKSELIKELEESYKYHRCHQLTYSIKTEKSVDIKNLSNLLSSFDSVINATLNKISSKVKSLPLYFDTVVQSPFGVLMSSDWDSELFDTSIERTFIKFFDIIDFLSAKLDSNDEDLIEQFFEDKGLMRKYRTFYRGISYFNNSIEIRWGGFLGKGERKKLIEHNDASNIYKRLTDLERPVADDFEVTGSIQGISLLDQAIQFVPHQKEGTIFRITFDKRFTEKLKPLLGEIATIAYRVTTEYDEVKDKTVTRKILLKIIEKNETQEDS